MENLSEEEIQKLIDERTVLRRQQRYTEADEIKLYLESHENIQLIDQPYRLGGNTTWVRKLKPLEENEEMSLINLSKEVFQLNNVSCDRVNEIIQQTKEYVIKIKKRKELLSQWKLTDTNLLTGRKYADIAFKFAMGGVNDLELFQLLTEGHLSEINRFGHRKSCGVMDLAQMAEKLACAGIIDQEVYQTTAKLIRIKMAEAESAGQILSCSSVESLESGHYSVLSDHPLRMLWRFAAKQSKHGKQRKESGDMNLVEEGEKDCNSGDVESESEEEEVSVNHSPSSLPTFESLFDDSRRPLVLDLGCGFGTSLLGLCMSMECKETPIIINFEHQSGDEEEEVKESPNKRIKRNESNQEIQSPLSEIYFQLQRTIQDMGCNFLGCDMSKRAVGYANSLATRWNIRNRCQFLHCSVDALLDNLLSSSTGYPGPIIWININFPTPYSQKLLPYVAEMQSFVHSKKTLNVTSSSHFTRISTSNLNGNSQLPDSLNDFMVTPSLLKKCAILFDKQVTRPQLGFIYLQSNAEDVALTMKSFIESLSLPDAHISFPELNPFNENIQLDGQFKCVDSQNSSISPFMMINLWSSKTNSSNMSWVTPETAAVVNDSKRQETWSEICSSLHSRLQAIGNGWWSESPLPTQARTETEALCCYQKKPIHRIIFSYSNETFT